MGVSIMTKITCTHSEVIHKGALARMIGVAIQCTRHNPDKQMPDQSSRLLRFSIVVDSMDLQLPQVT